MRASVRARGIASWILIVLGGIALLLGITLLYLRQEVLSPNAFAERAANSMDDPAVRDYVASQLTENVIEGAASQVIAARPLIETAIAGVVGSPVFRPIVRGAAAQLYGALATRSGGRAALGLTDAVVLAVQGLRSQPGVRLVLPPGVERAAIDLGERRPTGRLIRAADQVRVAALILLPVGVAFLLAAIAVAVRRRRAVAAVGATVAVVGAVIALTLPIGREIVERRLADDGITRGAVHGVWDAMLGGLATWAYGAVAVGLVLWLTAASVLRQVPLPTLVKRGWEWAMRPPRRRFEAVGRGVLLIVVAVLLVLEWDVAVLLAVLALAAALAVQGLTLILGVVAPAAVTPGEEGRAVVLPRVRVRRRAAVGALAVAAVGVIAGGIALGVRGPAAYGDSNVTACNGYAELCDRPVDEVAFAATHNAMSAADQPDWFRAEHRFGIPTQLKFGIRGFLIDSWYGLPSGKGNLVASDFDRAPDDSALAEAFQGYPQDARRAFIRLRGRLGFTGQGNSRPFLCHVFCEAGATDLVKGLGWFRQFLERNPGEVIILDIEDYIQPDDLRAAFAASGLLSYVYRPAPDQPWPTLGEMIDAGQRVIVMTEHRNGGIPWILPAYRGYLEETPYKFTLKTIGNPFISCAPNRGGTNRPFFLLNNWIESSVPSPSDAQKVNAFDTLLSRAQTCQRERGHVPNLVAVDFYRSGDVLGVVNVLNDLPRDAKPVRT